MENLIEGARRREELARDIRLRLLSIPEGAEQLEKDLRSILDKHRKYTLREIVKGEE